MRKPGSKQKSSKSKVSRKKSPSKTELQPKKQKTPLKKTEIKPEIPETKKEPKKRSTKAEKRQRVTKLIELVLIGLSRNEILQFTSNKMDWDVSDRQIDFYISDANLWLEEQSTFKRNREVGMAYAQLSDLYKRSMTISDYKTCLQIRKEMTRMLGLDRDIEKETNKGKFLEWMDSISDKNNRNT